MTGEEAPPLKQGEVGALLHGILFAYERVLKSLFKDEFKHLTPYLVEELSKVLYKEPNPIVDKDLPMRENIDRLLFSLSSEEVFKNMTLEEAGDNTYSLNLRECAYAQSGIHEILQTDEGVCPIALVFATMLASLDKETPNIEIVSSEFTDVGSITVITVKPIEDSGPTC